MKVPKVYKTRNGEEFYGVYRALVVDNEDPKKIGRVKVRVYSIHGVSEVSDDDLPWANYCSPFGSVNSGSFIIPEINNTVYVMFEGGDPKYPLYIGVSYSIGKSSTYEVGNSSGRKRSVRAKVLEKPVEATNNDIKVLYKSSKGSLIIFEDTDGNECIKFQDPLGQVIGIKSPLDEESSQDNDHLNLGMCNINATEKEDSGIDKLKKSAFILLESISKAYIKILTKITGKTYIILDNDYTSLKLNEDSFQLQTSNSGVAYIDGNLVVTSPCTIISGRQVNIKAPTINIDGNVSINGKSILNVTGSEELGFKVDLNQGGTNGEYIKLEEVEDEYSQV